MADFNLAIPVILEHEGSRFVNDKDDPGGATKYGISLRFLKDYLAGNKGRMQEFDIDRDGDVDADDIALFTREAATAIYREAFWSPDRLSDIDSQALATKLLDVAVHCGPSRMRRWALPASHTETIPFGKLAISRINAADPALLIRAIRERQIAHYHFIVNRRPSSGKYLAGWLKRAEL